MNRPTTTTTTTNSLSYSAALSQSLPAQKQQQQARAPPTRSPQAAAAPPPSPPPPPTQQPKRQPAPTHVPCTGNEDESVYVLTLLTDKALHERMTALRTKYFPKWNKLAAHLTLFHALPESKLESAIIPALQELAARTAPFRVEATAPFRLRRGFAISVSSQHGGRQGQRAQGELREAWRGGGWLSEQDAGGGRLHYTLMNKVDDEREVQTALEELQTYWRGDRGMAEGLALWRYDRGYWEWHRKFSFGGSPTTQHEA